MNSLSVLVKPASSACNMDCRYCFYKDEDKLRKNHAVKTMNSVTLEVMTRRLFEYTADRVGIVFQGGEPTLAGLDFFKNFMRFVRLYNRNNIKVDFSLQTNGLLLHEEWCDFLKENNFLVGLSFDGCPDVNDSNRVMYDGAGSSDQIVRTIRLLQRFNVDYNVLMVVTHQSAPHAKRCYEYLKGLGIQFLQVIPALDPYDGQGKEYSLSAEDLSMFLCDLFDVWYNDFIVQREVRVTYFENVIYKLMGNNFTMCSMNGRCSIETVIEADGSVYPCDFYVSDEWRLGNIMTEDIPSLIFSEKSKDFIAESIHIGDRCCDCSYFGLCIGSCRRYCHGEATEGLGRYCSAFRSFFEHSLPRMRTIAENMR